MGQDWMKNFCDAQTKKGKRRGQDERFEETVSQVLDRYRIQIDVLDRYRVTVLVLSLIHI